MLLVQSWNQVSSACPSGNSQNPRILLIENLGFAVSTGSVCVMLELSVKCIFGGGQLGDQLGRASQALGVGIVQGIMSHNWSQNCLTRKYWYSKSLLQGVDCHKNVRKSIHAHSKLNISHKPFSYCNFHWTRWLFVHQHLILVPKLLILLWLKLG